MKKYIKLLPLILYPYAYLIWLVVMYLVDDTLSARFNSDRVNNIHGIIFIVYQIWALWIAISGVINASKNDSSAWETAKINLVVKGCQIPAYIFHFIIGLLGMVMSVWGIGLIFLAIIVDLLTISLTGIYAIGCAVKMKKEGLLPTSVAVLTGVGSFIFCIDVVIAIIYVGLSKKSRN